MTLDQRMEYISRAVLCAKSCSMVTSVSGEGEFLHELEEKMEVSTAPAVTMIMTTMGCTTKLLHKRASMSIRLSVSLTANPLLPIDSFPSNYQ